MKHTLSSAGRCFILLLLFLLVLGGAINNYQAVKADFSVSTESKLLASDGASSDYFGNSVCISGDTAVVGAYNKNSGRGAAYVFIRSGSSWNQQAKLLAFDAAANDQFGCSVSISGDTVVVGAYQKTAYGLFSKAGAAYVFTRSGTAWTLQQELMEEGSVEANDWFGYSVGVSGDTLVVGTPSKSAGTGAAYIYTRSGTTWSFRTALSATDLPPTPYVAAGFGYAVSLGGGTAIVGAPGMGSAYVFTGSGASWTQQSKLYPSDASAIDLYGCSVSLSGDTAVVGAYLKNSSKVHAGAAYVFVRSGSSWSQQQKLASTDPADEDYFGYSVSVSGNTAIVGAVGNNSNTGAAYVFARSGTVWTQQTELMATDATNGSQFGESVSIDGGNAVVGANWKNSGAGAAYVYNNSATTPPTTTTTPPTTTTTPPTTTTTPPTTTTTPPTTTTTPPTTTTTPPTTTTTPPTTTTTPPTTTTTPPTTTTTPPTTTTTPPTTTTTPPTTSTTPPPTTTTTPASATTTSPATTTTSPATTIRPVNTTLPVTSVTAPATTDTTSPATTPPGNIPTTSDATTQSSPSTDQTPIYVWVVVIIATLIGIGAIVLIIGRRKG